MKSVLKNFSQITGGLLFKACLVSLCVFVFSSVGNAQSFKSATDAQVVLKDALMQLKQESLEEQAPTTLRPTNLDGVALDQEKALKYRYFMFLSNYLPNNDASGSVAIAIEEAHERISTRYSDRQAQLDALKQEAIILLSN